MRRLLQALLLAGAPLAAAAQITPIPWHPKTTVHEKAPAAKGAAAKPAEPPKFHMTFDKLTTLSPGVYVAEGNVRFETEGMLLTADSVTYDSDKGLLWATGQVAVDWNDFTVSGSELHYDMNTGTGVMRDAYGVQRDGDFTVYGKDIRKTGQDWYELDEGTMTSCTAAVPPWSMRVSKGRFHVDHYAFLTNPRFRVRSAPILYSPYLVWPIKPERSTGLLIPEIGSSSTKGFTFSNALFIAPQDWWDDTVYLDYFQKEGWGMGEEFRYVPSTATYGWFHGYYIKQDSDGQKRWDFVWSHLQSFRHGWYLVANINLLSDINFPRDYNRDFAEGTISGTNSNIYLTRNWGPYSLNFKVERNLQYWTDSQNLTQRTLPGIEFRSSLQPLFGGLYGGFESSADVFHKEWVTLDAASPITLQTTPYSVDYGRVDLHPFLEWPFHPTFWLDVTPRLELRATEYGQSLDPNTKQYDAGSLLRSYAKGSLDMAGPRFLRKYKNGLKHVIEPHLTYTYVSSDSKAYRAPIYDEVDAVGLGVDQLAYGVRNRLYAKDGDLVLDGDLYQSKSFDRPLSYLDGRTSRYSPVTLLMRFWPSNTWSGDFRLRFNILSHALDSQSFSLTYKPKAKLKDDFIRLTYLKTGTLGVSEYQNATLNPASEEARLSAYFTLVGDKVTINPYLARDIQMKAWRDARLVFWYHGSCYSIGFDVGKRVIGSFKETSYRFLISLKGAGTVVDLNAGTGTYTP